MNAVLTGTNVGQRIIYKKRKGNVGTNLSCCPFPLKTRTHTHREGGSWSTASVLGMMRQARAKAATANCSLEPMVSAQFSMCTESAASMHPPPGT